MAAGGDAVGTGRGGGRRSPRKGWRRFELRHGTRVGSIKDIDGFIGAIGEIIDLGFLIDPADVERVEAGGSVVRGTGGSFRADELAFDPKDNLLLVINNADMPPFGTFVKVTPASCVLTPPTSANKVPIDMAHGVDARNGAEQPVWDGDTGLFYLSIPQIGASVSHGGVVSIPPNGTKYTVLGAGIDFCSPAGLALGPKGDLFVGCNTVFDTAGNVWDPAGTVTAAPTRKTEASIRVFSAWGPATKCGSTPATATTTPPAAEVRSVRSPPPRPRVLPRSVSSTRRTRRCCSS